MDEFNPDMGYNLDTQRADFEHYSYEFELERAAHTIVSDIERYGTDALNRVLNEMGCSYSIK